jgi:hypothetical protein
MSSRLRQLDASDDCSSRITINISICTDESPKLIEMRLLTMLATAVLLAACVHDTDDFTLFLTESGVSLTYYIGSDGDVGEKNKEDPWDTISESFGSETVHTSKSGHDDPWDTINNKFGTETIHNGKSGEEDPWDRINELFPSESVHTGKTNDRYFFGIEKSRAVFVSFSNRMPTTFRARVTEVRGRVLKLEFTDGGEQYVIDAPASWMEGTQLETGFVEATSKKDRPFLGVRFWRTVPGSDWGVRSGNLVVVAPVAWPQEYQMSGGKLVVGLTVDQKLVDDPWDTINALLAKKAADPWDTIMERFYEAGKHEWEQYDPWHAINALFVAYVRSDHRSVVSDGLIEASTGPESPAISTSVVPASAPSPLTPKGGIKVVPDTINGELIWPDPWDKITEYSQRSY